ncbi:hypothetical protein Tco_0766868, partial [Tanacetum coccineum]
NEAVPYAQDPVLHLKLAFAATFLQASFKRLYDFSENESRKANFKTMFLQLFDWNVKSLKKLFLNKLNVPENLNQGRGNLNNLSYLRLPRYGYIKNHKKTVKNEQARTRESEEYKKKPKNQSRSQKSQASVKSSQRKVNHWSTKVNKTQNIPFSPSKLH